MTFLSAYAEKSKLRTVLCTMSRHACSGIDGCRIEAHSTAYYWYIVYCRAGSYRVGGWACLFRIVKARVLICPRVTRGFPASLLAHELCPTLPADHTRLLLYVYQSKDWSPFVALSQIIPLNVPKINQSAANPRRCLLYSVPWLSES